MASSERDLCRKLIVSSHLSVPEREALPRGRARFSVIRELIRESLETDGWFPEPMEPGRDIGEGAVLESREGHLWLHEQHEASVGRFGPIQSREVASVDEGVRLFISACHGWNPTIDGVSIDWES